MSKDRNCCTEKIYCLSFASNVLGDSCNIVAGLEK